MAAARFSTRGERLGGALGALAVQGLLGWVLVAGLAQHWRPQQSPAMQLLDFPVKPPPPEPEKPPVPKEARPRAEGKASPPNRVSRATEVVAPQVPLPQPMPAAPVAAKGSETMSGNAPVAGPGTGAGGTGTGTGSGGAGNGPGGGGGTPLRWLKGRIKDSDYPRAAWEAGASGTVGLRFTVGVNGRVTGCTVTRSSGNAELDATTCRLIEQRFRYEPSRDASGRPYADTVTGEHEWELDDRRGRESGD